MAAIVSPESPCPLPNGHGPARRGRWQSPERSAGLMANAIRALAMDAVQQGQLGPPRRADGYGRHGGRGLGPAPAPQPCQSPLARPRSLRALERARLDAALFAAAPHGLRPRALRAAQLPSIAQQDARPSRVRDHAGRRDDDRPARPGPDQRRRHGARRKAPRRRVQPRRPRRRRPPHLRLLRRRLPDGRDQPRGVRARGCLEARQADRGLRRQRHLDRRRGRAVVHRRHAEALRGLRLARHRQRRRPRRRRRRRGDCESALEHRQADADLLQDDDRQGCADARRHRQGARRSARRGRSQGDARGARLGARAVRTARRGLCGVGRGRERRRRRGRLARALRCLREAFPELAAEYTRRMAGDLPARWRAIVDAAAASAHAKAETVASRKASQIVLEAFTKELPELLGGKPT